MSHQLDQFIKDNEGKGLDFDGSFGFQCMDLAQFYNRDSIKAPRFFGNAINQWTNYPREAYGRVPYKAGKVPAKGDIVIWGSGVGQFGHIAIAVSSTLNEFVSFDQNWPLGSRCHKQKHNFAGVLGWLEQIVVPVPMPGITPDEIKDYFRKIWRREPAFGGLALF